MVNARLRFRAMWCSGVTGHNFEACGHPSCAGDHALHSIRGVCHVCFLFFIIIPVKHADVAYCMSLIKGPNVVKLLVVVKHACSLPTVKPPILGQIADGKCKIVFASL